jgi:hypothetical protein
MEIVIATSEDIWQVEPNATVVIDEEYGQLKHSALDMSLNIHFVSRGPSPLGYYRAVGRLHATVEKRRGLERDAWRCTLYQVAIVHDIPCILMVYDPIVLDEVRCPEQLHEVVISVPGRKCSSNESVDKNVGRCGGALRTTEVSHKTKGRLN